MIDCIVNLPAKLFLNTQIPAALWFMRRDRHNSNQYRDRSKEILFIDARNLGHLINRRTKVLSDDDIKPSLIPIITGVTKVATTKTSLVSVRQ